MKCGQCKWLSSKQTPRGYECLNPTKQKKWAEQERRRLAGGLDWHAVQVRYKKPAALACASFVPKEEAKNNELNI